MYTSNPSTERLDQTQGLVSLQESGGREELGSQGETPRGKSIKKPAMEEHWYSCPKLASFPPSGEVRIVLIPCFWTEIINLCWFCWFWVQSPVSQTSLKITVWPKTPLNSRSSLPECWDHRQIPKPWLHLYCFRHQVDGKVHSWSRDTLSCPCVCTCFCVVDHCCCHPPPHHAHLSIPIWTQGFLIIKQAVTAKLYL